MLRGAAVLVFACAVACGAPSGRPVALPANLAPQTAVPSESPSPSPSPLPAPSTRPHDPLTGNGEAVTIAFGGDVHFEGAIRRTLARDPAEVFGPVAALLSAADLAMVNLETAVTTRGAPQDKKYTFRAPATAFEALRAGGVDVVTEANNHGVDFGAVGLRDTIAAARAAAFRVVGIGTDEDMAYRPYVVTVRGQRIAFIGASQIIDPPLVDYWTATAHHPGIASAYRVDRLLESVRLARSVADTVVVYLHWGTEHDGCPNTAQRRLAPKLVKAGADIVVGSHAHVLLGTGKLGNALVSYGLGNFVFYSNSGSPSVTGVLTVTVTGRTIDRYTWAPAVIRGGAPRPLAGNAAGAAEQRWQNLRGCAGLAP